VEGEEVDYQTKHQIFFTVTLHNFLLFLNYTHITQHTFVQLTPISKKKKQTIIRSSLLKEGIHSFLGWNMMMAMSLVFSTYTI